MPELTDQNLEKITFAAVVILTLALGLGGIGTLLFATTWFQLIKAGIMIVIAAIIVANAQQ